MNVNTNVAKAIELPDGTRVVLIDMYGNTDGVNASVRESNVYRLDRDGRVIWQIAAEPPVRPGSSFTGLGFDDSGKLIGYRSDGVDHEIDLDTGVVVRTELGR